MEKKCSIPFCSRPPAFFCSCNETITIICDFHIKQHSSEFPNLIHAYNSISQIISQDKKANIISEIHITIEKFIKERRDFIYLTESLILQIQKICKNFCSNTHRKISSYKSFLIQILKPNGLENLSQTYNQNPPITILKDIENKVNRELKICLTEEFESLKTISGRFIEQINMLMNVKFNEDQEKNYENLYFFKENTKSFVEFSPDSLKLYSENLKVNENQGHLSAICLIPDNKVFISGGCSNITLNISYIIDIDSKNIEALFRKRSRSHASAIYKNNKIYIFGGKDESGELICADSYDLLMKKWVTLALLPLPAMLTSIVDLNDKFLIAGKPNLMCTYDLLTNSYSKITSHLQINSYNILIKDGNNIHFLHKSLVNLTKEDDLDHWQSIPLIGDFSYTTSRPVFREGCAYFVDWDCIIYQYKFGSYEVKAIAKA
ncbi:hypothetical protein SteCoe_15062 [Stentor coeruleus]|uniref:Kelch motif family protein n=1 Tax=Stentor coeruleus TaxID=5963 RepID=A0A1R2C4I5_9CILI|nr:hypothetical protein SteCoe_15062 [Stentor coeruleus]